MRRLTLASLAFLLLFLPFQVGGVSVAATMPCCPCMGTAPCPPACPPPSPFSACASAVPTASLPTEAPEAASQRAEEASPIPAAETPRALSRDRRPGAFASAGFRGPPDRGDGQARLGVFRI